MFIGNCPSFWKKAHIVRNQRRNLRNQSPDSPFHRSHTLDSSIRDHRNHCLCEAWKLPWSSHTLEMHYLILTFREQKQRTSNDQPSDTLQSFYLYSHLHRNRTRDCCSPARFCLHLTFKTLLNIQKRKKYSNPIADIVVSFPLAEVVVRTSLRVQG